MFAVAMMALAGTWAVIEGIAAIAGSRMYTDNAVFIFSDLKTWGWIVLLLGHPAPVRGVHGLQRSQFARWFGIFAAGVNALGQLFFIQAYPLWSIAMFAADIIIIYALAVYAGPRLRD